MSQINAPISIADQIINLLTAAKAGKKLQRLSTPNGWIPYTGTPDQLTGAIAFHGARQFRVAPSVKREPLTAKDFPPGTVVRYRDQSKDAYVIVQGVGPGGIVFQTNGGSIKFREFTHPELITGQLRRKLPGKDSKWIRSYKRTEVPQTEVPQTEVPQTEVPQTEVPQ